MQRLCILGFFFAIVWKEGGSNSHLQMSVISVGTGSSLVSLGIMAKPPRAYKKPPMEIRLRELRSCGNSVNSDHLEQNVSVNSQQSTDGVSPDAELLDDTISRAASAGL